MSSFEFRPNKNCIENSQIIYNTNPFSQHKPILVKISDTAGAAEEISKLSDKSRAAIASELAAKIYGLKILRKNIEDASHNTTRFLVMEKKPNYYKKKDVLYITSFIFKVRI